LARAVGNKRQRDQLTVGKLRRALLHRYASRSRGERTIEARRGGTNTADHAPSADDDDGQSVTAAARAASGKRNERNDQIA
jgi:hypothetical protein